MRCGAPVHGPDGLIYPGTCRPDAPLSGPLPDAVLRLDMARAAQDIAFAETGAGAPNGTIHIKAETLAEEVGDVVLARRDMGASYHLGVVLDDADQQITHVIRGEDLFAATQIHVLLQKLLHLPTPIYHHHKLIRDENGKRLAKRDNARAIATYRADGNTPQDIRNMLGS